MTPLLHKIVADLCLPKRKRRLVYRQGDDGELLRPMLDGVQSFECSAVEDVATDLAERFITDETLLSKRTAFLPAGRTWIELSGDGFRSAYLLVDEKRSNRIAKALWIVGKGNVVNVATDDGGLFLTDHAQLGHIVNYPTALQLSEYIAQANREFLTEDEHAYRAWAVERFQSAVIYALLGIINTPHVFLRTTHNPHAGLQRRLIATRPLVGKYPLGAWTEILLKVPAPLPDGQGPSRGYLTGDRAAHWCRQYLRYRLGRWEIVRDHWRGNPAIGIKRSRYRLEEAKEV